jgi:prepilin peptidase CpaA
MRADFLLLLLPVILGGLLVWAAVTDLRARIIDNWLNAVIALLAPVYWLASGLSPWPDMAIQIGLGLGILGVFAGLFALGMMGGGDVKLLAALALWMPAVTMVSLLVLMSLIGGVVTLISVIRHRTQRRTGPVEVPYGVAISLAGLWVISEPYINHFT